MRELAVDVGEVSAAMGDRTRTRNDYYLDTRTGRVAAVSRDALRSAAGGAAGSGAGELDRQEIRIARKVVLEGEGRYERVPERLADDGYDLMVRFAGSVADPGLREELARALRESPALDRFDAVLAGRPGERGRWLEFQREYAAEDAMEWLWSLGLIPAGG